MQTYACLFSLIFPQVCNGKRSQDTKLPEPKDRAALRVQGLHTLASTVTVTYIPTCTHHTKRSHSQTHTQTRYPECKTRPRGVTDGNGAKRWRRQTFTTKYRRQCNTGTCSPRRPAMHDDSTFDSHPDQSINPRSTLTSSCEKPHRTIALINHDRFERLQESRRGRSSRYPEGIYMRRAILSNRKCSVAPTSPGCRLITFHPTTTTHRQIQVSAPAPPPVSQVLARMMARALVPLIRRDIVR